MRYRFYFEHQQPTEITAFDFKMRTPRSIVAWPHGSEGRGPTVDIGFAEKIVRIADDHDRTVYDDITEPVLTGACLVGGPKR